MASDVGLIQPDQSCQGEQRSNVGADEYPYDPARYPLPKGCVLQRDLIGDGQTDPFCLAVEANDLRYRSKCLWLLFGVESALVCGRLITRQARPSPRAFPRSERW